MKIQKSQFNDLLRSYNKYLRKLGRLKITGRNLHRQSVLHRHIERLRAKLQGLYLSIKGATALAAVSAFCMMATPEVHAQASYAAVQNNPFSLTNAGYYTDPSFADLDNDGDLDLMLGEGYGNFLYFENTGTASAPAFASVSSNPFSLTSVGESSAPTFADLDGDGDLDLIVGEYYGTFNYFENTGTASSPAFAAVVENAFSLPDIGYYSNPVFADLDDDGDLDLMAGEGNGNFKYFENTGSASSPAFASAQNNPFALTDIGLLSSPSFADLDGDGDLDLISGEMYGSFKYFENTGTVSNPTFASVQDNPFALAGIGQRSTPAFVDLDNDGDFDLMVGEYYGNFKYFENVFDAGTSNNTPTVANPIADQNIDEGVALDFQFAENTFADQDAGDILTYSATLADDTALPSWLTFTASTRTFAGIPSSEDVGTITIKVTATDSGEGNLSISDEFDLTINSLNDPNNAPTVANPIADQSIDEGVALNFQFAENTFADEDAGDVLTYAATLSDGTALPAWLTFTASTRTFAGTPSSEDVGTITIKVTATDSGEGNLSISDEFDLTINVVLSINSNSVRNEMIVYANANGINIRIEETLSNTTISIYDLRGTLIKQVKSVDFIGSVWNTTFDKQGLFVITVLSENQLFVNKFVK